MRLLCLFAAKSIYGNDSSSCSHGNDGSLAKSAREALHAAATLHKSLAGSKLVVGLIGENVQAAANSIAACPATKYFGVTGADFSQSRYATDAAAAEAICKAAQATVVVAPATSRWARVLPGVAQRLGGRADTHVTGVGGGGRKNFRQPLVLSPAHGRRADAHAASVVPRH